MKQRKIIYPTNVHWEWMQRPQHLLSVFADLGFECIFGDFTESDKVVKHNLIRDKQWVKHVDNNSVIFNNNPGHKIVFDEGTRAEWVKDAVLWFDYIDDVSVFEDSSGKDLKQAQENYIRYADIVTTSAKTLYNEIRDKRPDAILVPNAVDLDFFSTPPREVYDYSQHGKFDGVVGYYGAIAFWLNYELMKFMCEKHPEFLFVMIGGDYKPNENVIKQLGKYPNFLRIKRQPYENLPYYLYGFDVAIIPFLENEISEDTSPLKVYEYLAAGRPVVCSDMPEVKELFPVKTVNVSKDGMSAFARAVEKEFLRDCREMRSIRKECVKEETWKKRVFDILYNYQEKFYYDAGSVTVVPTQKRGMRWNQS